LTFADFQQILATLNKSIDLREDRALIENPARWWQAEK